MHILLTDILSCPRCGPEFGLILLADRIESRRVLAGTLGCANCRSRYPVHDGVADLRATDSRTAEPGAEPETPDSARAGAGEQTRDERVSAAEHGAAENRETPRRADASTDAAMRWAALLGVTEGPAYLLLTGPVAALAGEIAALIEHIEVIAATDVPAATQPVPGVSRIAVAGRLPFYTGYVHGVALSGDSADTLLEEGARVLRPLGRLVLEPAPPDAEERIGGAGLHLLAKQDRTLVAARTV